MAHTIRDYGFMERIVLTLWRLLALEAGHERHRPEERGALGSPRKAPLARRLYAWAEERFPFANALLVCGHLRVGAAARPARRRARAPCSALGDSLGYAAAVGFFLMLRIFDEHKDFANDCRLYPERVLSVRDRDSCAIWKVLRSASPSRCSSLARPRTAATAMSTLRWLVMIALEPPHAARVLRARAGSSATSSSTPSRTCW